MGLFDQEEAEFGRAPDSVFEEPDDQIDQLEPPPQPTSSGTNVRSGVRKHSGPIRSEWVWVSLILILAGVLVSTVVLEDPVGTNVAILLDPSSVDRLDVGAPFVDDLFRTIEREHVSPETVSLDTIPHGVPILPLAAFIAGMRQQEPQVGPIVAAGIPLDGEILTRVVNLITGEHVLEQLVSGGGRLGRQAIAVDQLISDERRLGVNALHHVG